MRLSHDWLQLRSNHVQTCKLIAFNNCTPIRSMMKVHVITNQSSVRVNNYSPKVAIYDLMLINHE